MEELKSNNSTYNNNINLINQKIQNPSQDSNNLKNLNNTREEHYYSSNEDILNYGENTFKENNNNKNPENLERKNNDKNNYDENSFNKDIYKKKI